MNSEGRPPLTSLEAEAISHPGIRTDSRLTKELVAHYESTGQWTNQTLSSLLKDAATEQPDRVAAVDHAGAGGSRRALTFHELDQLVTRMAHGLRCRGVRPGDSIVVMLPNCIEFAALIFAINRAGGVYTGIPIAYGRSEVAQILHVTRARVVVVQDRIGSATPLQVVRDSMPEDDAPSLYVRGTSTPLRGETHLTDLPSDPDGELPTLDPRAICHVGFTSGTTGDPKGVMNTSQTLIAVLRNWVSYFGRENLGSPVVNAVVSPVGHHSGFLWGVVLSAFLQGTAVYMQKWNPQRAADLFCDEHVTVYFGAPTFLQDLLTTKLASDPGSALCSVITTGSPVPRALPGEARQALGSWVGSAWGMTEIGLGISCRPGMTDEEMLSDGRSFPGVETRTVDEVGVPVPPGRLGRLQVRSAGLFLGYKDQPDKTRQEINQECWFETGDNARITEESLVFLEGRNKDLIIRGGENIPVVAVESALYSHPAVVDVALVGVPDERLGERACAVVVLNTDSVTLDDLNAHLLQSGVSKHFLPERMVVVSELPKTPSGKIRKVELRHGIGSL